MRRVPLLLFAFACALLAAAPAPANASARAVDITPVLPAPSMASRTFAPDSAAPPESTAFLQFMGVCPAPRCDSGGPICPKDSITVTLGGSLPSDCFIIRRIELYYPPIMSIRPFAPWVVVVVDDQACLDRLCHVGRYPWTGKINMPPLPEGPYSLDVVVVRVSCTDSIPPLPSPQHSMPFTVASCDSTPPTQNGCLVGDWRHHEPGCDATVSPSGHTVVLFTLRSLLAPVAALQGNFELVPPTLQITDITPRGDASGWRLSWTPTSTGARFVMFDEGGRPLSPDSLGASAHEILAIQVSAPPGVVVPAETHLLARDLAGSDPNGALVPECMVISMLPGFSPYAKICGVGDCDANKDTRIDVRDLVLMVHCLHSRQVCPMTFDCNRDGSFTLDDILCCAWRILRIKPCTNPIDCPPDSTPAKDRSVRVNVGLPLEVADEVRVPIHIDRADQLGAARLAMNFPASRWRIVSLDTDDSAWLTLAGEDNGQIIMGAIRISDAPAAGGLDLTLRLAPVGAAAGGELGTLTADVSGTDGAMLSAAVVAPIRPLPGGLVVELSENRPDPFSGETRFTLSLPAATAVELSVYDLNGRRVATLHHGALAAGVSEFGWSGRSDAGSRLGAGVYFYRAVIGGRAVSRRMVYLGGN